MYHPLLIFLLLVTSKILLVGHADASGFALPNQSGAEAGYAFAGAAAVAQDASTIFSNPAGMTNLAPGHHVSGVLSIPMSSLRFKNTGSSESLGANNGGQAGGVAIIPAGYWSMPITPALRVGLGLSPTFGSTTDWSKSFVGRYQGTLSELTAINANPSIAWRINNIISLGAGFNIVRLDADLRSMGRPPTSTLVDEAKLTGSDIGFGYNLGAMLQLNPVTRLGITYRSAVNLTADGNFTSPGANYSASASIRLPDTVSVAMSHMFTDRLQLLADFTWTGWSSIPPLALTNLPGGNSLPISERMVFRGSYRLGFGTQYQYTDTLRLKMGVAYDQSPVRNAMNRTVRLPDSDRILLAVGFNQKIGKRTSVDVAYTHIFFEKAKIDRPNNPLSPLSPPGVVRGSFSNSMDVVSIQLNHQF